MGCCWIVAGMLLGCCSDVARGVVCGMLLECSWGVAEMLPGCLGDVAG